MYSFEDTTSFEYRVRSSVDIDVRFFDFRNSLSLLLMCVDVEQFLEWAAERGVVPADPETDYIQDEEMP